MGHILWGHLRTPWMETTIIWTRQFKLCLPMVYVLHAHAILVTSEILSQMGFEQMHMGCNSL